MYATNFIFCSPIEPNSNKNPILKIKSIGNRQGIKQKITSNTRGIINAIRNVDLSSPEQYQSHWDTGYGGGLTTVLRHDY
jgi:hypothetical protein